MLPVRALLRRPALTGAALITLALGIGANTAVFSVVNAVLLRPLPYREPARLAAIWPGHFFSNAEVLTMQRDARAFEMVAAFSPGWGVALSGDGEAQQLMGARTSTNFLATIGVAPALGRGFAPEESRPGNDRVVLLSDPLWRTRFGADPGIIGRRVLLDGDPHVVIGVMPPGFEFYSTRNDIWLPLVVDPTAWFHTGGVSVALGRLRSGETLARATAELRALVPAMRAEIRAGTEYGRDARVVELRDMIVGPVRGTFLVLLGAVGFIVLIAAANVGNLLLVRAAERRREIAVRTALGASRGSIVRLMLGESLALSIAGAVAGLALGAAALPVLRSMLPDSLPRLGEIGLDLSVLGTCVLAALLTGTVFAAAPALLAARVDPQAALGSVRGADAAGRIGQRARASLVTTEIALAVVLVVGAGLMVQTLWRLTRVDPGFHPEQVVTFRLQPVNSRLDTNEKIGAYFDEIETRAAALPGVSAVGTIHHLPLGGASWYADLEVEDHPVPAGAPRPRVAWRLIDGDYFRAMGIPLLAGRAFDDRDTPANERVVIISETVARQTWPGENAIGRRLRAGNATREEGGGAREPAWVTVVGVVGSVRHDALQQLPGPEIYRPTAQKGAAARYVIVRTTADPVRTLASLRDIVRAVDADVPISELRTLQDVVSGSMARPRLVLWLLLLFALVGLVLGGVGVYGVVAYTVSRRTHEIGIRMALGAGSGRIGRMVVGQGMRYAVAGITIGTLAALALTRAMREIVYEVRTSDPLTYVGVGAFMVMVVALASWIPARRAGRVEPVEALREQ